MSVNQHHILFDRAAWRSSEVRRDLRENRWLIPPLKLEGHQLLHKAVSVVPVLDYRVAFRTRDNFESEPGNFIRSIGNFMLSLEDALRHPRVDELQRSLGELTLAAVEQEIPFVEEYCVWRRT